MTFLVTGGTRGIGRGIVLDAAAAGHDVAFTYVSRPDLAEEVLAEAKKLAPDRQVKAYPLNVADSAASISVPSSPISVLTAAILSVTFSRPRTAFRYFL